MKRDTKSSGKKTARLRASEEQFRLLVETVEDYAIFMLDPEGKVATWNLGAQRIKGYKTDDIIGKHFACFYTEQDVANGKPQRNLSDAQALGHTRDSGLRVRKDGSQFF